MVLFLKVLRFDDDFVDYDLSTSIGTSGGSIGRSGDNNLALPDTEGYVSRIHAKIETDGNSFFIVDCSSNGTLLLELIPDSEEAYNEVLIHQDRRELFDGDFIVIGQFEIQIQYSETVSDPDIIKEVNVSQPKVDSTLPKNEASEEAFKSPVFPKTPVVGVDREDYESESVDRSAFQQHFPDPVAVAKEPPEPENVKPDNIEPEVFNIDDFFADDDNGNEQSANENFANDEDDIFAGFQDPFAEELETEKIAPETTQTEEKIKLSAEPSPNTKLADEIDQPPIPEQNSVNISAEIDQPVNISDSSLEPIVQDQTEAQSVFQGHTDAFFTGVGLDKTDLPEGVELDQLMLKAGKMLRTLLDADISLLRARADLKREFSSSMEVIQKEENNPLKFCKSVDEALPYLLLENSPGFLTGQLAVNESVSDIQTHQMATMAGIQAAILGTINKFDPAVVEKGCENGFINIDKASKYRDFYKASYNKLSKEAQAEFFGSDFAEAYQRQTNALKKQIEPPNKCAESEEVKHDRVEFAIFSPFKIERGSDFELDVWAYLPNQSNLIAGFAKKIGRDKPLERMQSVPIERDTILTVTIEIDNLEVKNPVGIIFWSGHPVNVSYTVHVPYNNSNEQYRGRALIRYQGILIAKITFLVSLNDTTNRDYKNHLQETFYPKTAFASYASENRDDVLCRIQGMKKIAPDLDIFLDVFSLRTGENWKATLEKHVPNKDVFFLFWSKNSAKSKWVEREWKLALSKRGLDYINPVLLEDIETAPPPPELESLHFSDVYVAYIQYEKIKKKMRAIKDTGE